MIHVFNDSGKAGDKNGPLVIFFFLSSFINTNYYIQIRMGWFRDDENKWL